MSDMTMMGSEYGKPGDRWDPNADALYNKEHSIDPNSGLVTGPLGPVPAGVGALWQAAHEQATARVRFGLGQSALAYQQGALGLLQSFRPGGGAAIEAGIYSQLGNTQLNRAAMLEPLDLLGDYRRHEQHQQRKAQKKAGVIQAITGVASAAAMAMIPGIGPVLAGAQLANTAGKLAAGQAGTASAAQAAGQQPNALNAYGGAVPGTTLGQPGMGQTALPASAAGGVAPVNGNLPGSAAGGIPQTVGQSTLAPGGQQQGQQGSQGQGTQAGGQQGGMGSPGGQALPVGLDGNFSPTAYAMNAVARGQGGMQIADVQALAGEMHQIAMAEMVADDLDSDPDWMALDNAVRAQVALRSA